MIGCGGNSVSTPQPPKTYRVMVSDEGQLTMLDKENHIFNMSGKQSLYTDMMNHGNAGNIHQTGFHGETMDWQLVLAAASRGGQQLIPLAIIGQHQLIITMPQPVARGGTPTFDVSFDGTHIGEVSSNKGNFQVDLQKLIQANAKTVIDDNSNYTLVIVMEGAVDATLGLTHNPY